MPLVGHLCCCLASDCVLYVSWETSTECPQEPCSVRRLGGPLLQTGMSPELSSAAVAARTCPCDPKDDLIHLSPWYLPGVKETKSLPVFCWPRDSLWTPVQTKPTVQKGGRRGHKGWCWDKLRTQGALGFKKGKGAEEEQER